MTQGTVVRPRPGLSGPEELRNNSVVKNVGEARETPTGPQEELATGERSTRNRVARSILDHGPSTVAELAGRLGLTQAAVRRHLDALAADDIVQAREQRVYGARTRGRPAKVFALTACGRDAFDQSYDQLAADALRWIAEREGGERPSRPSPAPASPPRRTPTVRPSRESNPTAAPKPSPGP